MTQIDALQLSSDAQSRNSYSRASYVVPCNLASEFDEREQASQGHDDDEGNGNGDTV